MKLTIDAKDLAKVTKLVSGIIVSKPVKPILGCVLFKDGHLYSTDMETTIKQKLPCEFEGAVAVDGKRLASIAGTLKGEVVIERENEKMVLLIKAGKTRLEMPIMNELDYPPVDYKEGETFTMNGSALKEILNHVVYASSTDEYMKNLNTVYWEAVDDKTRWVTADGFRLSLYETGMFGEPCTRLVSLKTVHNLLKVLNDEPIKIGFVSSKMSFSMGDTTVYSRVSDFNFPDYQKVLPGSFEVGITADKTALIAALQIIQQVVGGTGEAAKLEVLENELIITGKSTDAGVAETRVDIDNMNLGAIKIACNPLFLLDAIKHTDTEDGKILLRFTDSKGPVQIEGNTQQEGTNHISIVMPVRTN